MHGAQKLILRRFFMAEEIENVQPAQDKPAQTEGEGKGSFLPEQPRRGGFWGKVDE